MARTVGIGIQDFGKIIENDYFYVDKTAFIKEWWESDADHQAAAVWKDPYHEHGGAVFFAEICRTRRPV